MALRSWTAGVPLSIWVRVHNDQSTPVWSPSDEVIVTPIAGAPAVPTMFAAAGNGQSSLEWLPVAGATTYRIWRADGPDKPMLPYAVTTSAHVVAQPSGVTTTWAVSAVSGSYESSWSVEQDTASVPFVPVMPTVTVTSHAGAIMFDAGLVGDQLRWEVARSSSPHYNFVDVPLTTEYRGRFVVAAPSGSAYYRIRACFPLGGCGGDRYVTAAPAASAPAAPAWIAETLGNSEITVTWEAIAGATAYRVFRAPGYLHHQGKFESIAVVAAGRFTDRYLANEAGYVYAVSAISGGGESELAEVDEATPLARYALAPANVTATAANASITVRWDPSPGATSCSVCRSTTFDGATGCTTTTASQYVDTSVASGATYYYSVSAQGGAFSNVVSAAVP